MSSDPRPHTARHPDGRVNIDLERRFEALFAETAAVRTLAGTGGTGSTAGTGSGAAGPVGPQGPVGPAGPAGASTGAFTFTTNTDGYVVIDNIAYATNASGYVVIG